MDREEVLRLIEAFESHTLGKKELIDALLSQDFSDIGHTKVDTGRLHRLGFPEVVYCRNKLTEEILDIAEKLYEKNGFVLLTKASEEHYNALRQRFHDAVFHERASMISIGQGMPKRGRVSVLSGGTSDTPVAEEAAVTAEVFGCMVNRIYDVGVAGLHRLFSHRARIEGSNAIVAVAGMEGALPSVVGGLFAIPIIGVPTSVGYGAGLNGFTPLLTMLNSCAPGVAVVNIDNGFGAGYIASLINKKIEGARKHT
jgi:NCAIR mutase (PurE)-related protein